MRADAGAGLAIVGAALAGIGAGLGYGAVLSGDIASNPAMARQAATAQTLSTVGFLGLGIGAVTADRSPFATSPVPAMLQVTKADGGPVTLTSVPVTGAQADFQGAAGTYSGQLVLSGADGMKSFFAGWQGVGLPGHSRGLQC